VEIQVFGKYVDAKKVRLLPASLLPTTDINNLAQQLAELGQQAKAAAGSQLMVANVIALLLTDLEEKKAPEAFMGYALYDADSNLYEKGKIILSKKARNEHEELKTRIFVPQDGFMRTFLVNETSENVWFDQFRIQNTTPVILQETHYDPWGVELQGLGYQQGGIKANKYLYQEKEFQDGLNLNIYDFHARGYDPAIGRTMQMDPHAENYLDLSPYSWGANNPISIIDPTGMDTVNYNNVDWKNFKTDTDVLGLDEVVFTFGSGNYPSLSDINGQNQKAMSGWVDAAQMGLDVIGMTEIPFVSQGAELVSAGISFGRGDTFGGLIGLGSMIPILGKTFEATKIARYAAKGVKTQWGWSGTKV
jgi:RHS repeat-associated protein